jgi:hypothetical protein
MHSGGDFGDGKLDYLHRDFNIIFPYKKINRAFTDFHRDFLSISYQHIYHLSVSFAQSTNSTIIFMFGGVT